MSYEDEPLDEDFHRHDSYPAIKTALDRVRIPAILLIIVGVLNIPGGMFWALTGASAIWNSESNAQMAKQLNLPTTDPGSSKVAGIFYFGLCAVSLIAAAITILGGVRMMSLKSYGLAVVASALAVIPCISPTGCCGIGEVVGIWSFVVLMNADVRSEFR